MIFRNEDDQCIWKVRDFESGLGVGTASLDNTVCLLARCVPLAIASVWAVLEEVRRSYVVQAFFVAQTERIIDGFLSCLVPERF